MRSCLTRRQAENVSLRWQWARFPLLQGRSSTAHIPIHDCSGRIFYLLRVCLISKLRTTHETLTKIAKKLVHLARLDKLGVCLIGRRPENCPVRDSPQPERSAVTCRTVPHTGAVYGRALQSHPITDVRPRWRLSRGGSALAQSGLSRGGDAPSPVPPRRSTPV